MYCLDTREGELITILKDVPVKQLPVGDIWIGLKEDQVQEGALIIERKSIRDFEASFLDGRYKEQRGRILAFCHEHKAQPMYILEGALSSGTGRLQKSAILKLIHRLIFHYQLPVMQTGSVQETAEVIQALAEQWTKNPQDLQRTTELVKVTDGIHVQKKANASDYRQFAMQCLVQCPGVSVNMATALLDVCNTLKGVMDMPVKELAVIKVGARKVGPVVAERLHNLLNQVAL